MLNLDSFLDLFPELNNSDLLKTESLLNQLAIEHDGYAGLGTKADLALGLHTAHYLTVDGQISGVSAPGSGAGNIKRIKSNNDELEYYQISDRYSFDKTSYGGRLQRLLDSSYLGGYFI